MKLSILALLVSATVKAEGEIYEDEDPITDECSKNEDCLYEGGDEHRTCGKVKGEDKNTCVDCRRCFGRDFWHTYRESK